MAAISAAKFPPPSLLVGGLIDPLPDGAIAAS